MNSKLKIVLAAVFISASLISVGFYLANYYNQVQANKIQSIANLITLNYAGTLDEETIVNNIIKGLNDEYSYYLNREEYQKEKQAMLQSPSLSLKKLNESIYYLQIFRFQENTIDEFKQLFTDTKQEYLNKLIIDLRENLGGNIEAALYIEKQFIEKGTLLIEKNKNQKEITHLVKESAPYKNTQIIILVNKETSSAAEQMAAAFQDNNRAKIIGETTFGKSSIGNYFELKDGSAIHLTIGNWYRPNKESVNKIGIKPDVEISDETKNETDEVLNQAILLLK